jgi:hypothetical protein
VASGAAGLSRAGGRRVNSYYLPPGYGATATAGATITAPNIDWTGGPLPRSWLVSRTHIGPQRWSWRATGPKGSDSGWALSEAVARSRALRAYEELA